MSEAAEASGLCRVLITPVNGTLRRSAAHFAIKQHSCQTDNYRIKVVALSRPVCGSRYPRGGAPGWGWWCRRIQMGII